MKNAFWGHQRGGSSWKMHFPVISAAAGHVSGRGSWIGRVFRIVQTGFGGRFLPETGFLVASCVFTAISKRFVVEDECLGASLKTLNVAPKVLIVTPKVFAVMPKVFAVALKVFAVVPKVLPMTGKVLPATDKVLSMTAKVLPTTSKVLPMAGKVFPASSQRCPAAGQGLPVVGQPLPELTTAPNVRGYRFRSQRERLQIRRTVFVGSGVAAVVGKTLPDALAHGLAASALVCVIPFSRPRLLRWV